MKSWRFYWSHHPLRRVTYYSVLHLNANLHDTVWVKNSSPSVATFLLCLLHRVMYRTDLIQPLLSTLLSPVVLWDRPFHLCQWNLTLRLLITVAAHTRLTNNNNNAHHTTMLPTWIHHVPILLPTLRHPSQLDHNTLTLLSSNSPILLLIRAVALFHLVVNPLPHSTAIVHLHHLCLDLAVVLVTTLLLLCTRLFCLPLITRNPTRVVLIMVEEMEVKRGVIWRQLDSSNSNILLWIGYPANSNNGYPPNSGYPPQNSNAGNRNSYPGYNTSSPYPPQQSTFGFPEPQQFPGGYIPHSDPLGTPFAAHQGTFPPPAHNGYPPPTNGSYPPQQHQGGYPPSGYPPYQ